MIASKTDPITVRVLAASLGQAPLCRAALARRCSPNLATREPTGEREIENSCKITRAIAAMPDAATIQGQCNCTGMMASSVGLLPVHVKTGRMSTIVPWHHRRTKPAETAPFRAAVVLNLNVRSCISKRMPLTNLAVSCGMRTARTPSNIYPTACPPRVWKVRKADRNKT